FVSDNYFRTVGVSLDRGPGFTAAEPGVIVGYDFWRSALNSAPDIIGKSITLDDVAHVVVGIAPTGYRGHLDDDAAPGGQLFLPLERHPRLRTDHNLLSNRDIDRVHIYGRLKEG